MNETQKQLLLIDEDPLFSKACSEYLLMQGFQVDRVQSAQEGLKKALYQEYDIILLDIFLSEYNGFQVLEEIRKYSDVPMLFLTHFDTTLHHWLGRLLGIDDYVKKSVHPCELILRIHSLLARQPAVKKVKKCLLEFQGMQLDCAQRKGYFKDNVLDLTNTEFNILEILLKSPEQVFSKEELTEYALGKKFTAYDRSIDVHISHLRTKLKQYLIHQAPQIKTVRGFGYALYKT